MIIRHWTYRAKIEQAQKFEEFEKGIALPMIQAQPGCQRVELFRLKTDVQPTDKTVAQYLLISHWESSVALQTALASKEYQNEIALFLSQEFGESGNGTISHYDLL